MDLVGGRRILNRMKRLRVAYPLRFCFVGVVCVPDDSAGQRVGNSLLRGQTNQPPTIASSAGGLPSLMTSRTAAVPCSRPLLR